ncbi:DUF3887 domain-containing protein [Frateuria soli]|uniref:DUF3887 domain-containing protein n=1 Tax=Frateuria soli TaxID=1542730 RepID=UPI001E337736|nr:DUF3887 domain-containing protein [Frateuria soli]UGB37396.1 DUF3887 domain-containing protein [Frateuria soli]
MRTSTLLALSLACIASGPGHASALGDQCLALAPKFTEAFVSGDYAGAHRELDGFARAMASPESLKSDWADMNREFGAYVSHGKPVVFQDDGRDAFIRTPMTFARRTVTVQVVCSRDTHGRIGSLAFL